MNRKSLQIASILIAVAVAYELVLWRGSKWVEIFLYSGRYADYAWLIALVGFVPLINAIQLRYSLILRALQRPVFYVLDKVLAALLS
jgi:hypothetical protein